MAGALLLRKEVDELQDQELETLRSGYAAMQAIADNRGFNYLSGLHGIPGHYCVHYDDPPLFLPWHRAYLHDFEQFLQDRLTEIQGRPGGTTIPWWDWTSVRSHASGVPPAFASRQRPDGTANPLSSSQINEPSANPPILRASRRFPMSPQQLPNEPEVELLLNLTDFEDFSLQLRTGLHNRIHGWTGGMDIVNGRLIPGDMGVVAVAAFDPIFYSHHCMIDRIWYLWQLRHGVHNIPPGIAGTVLPPFSVTVSDVLDIHALGYDYAVAAASMPGSA